MASPPDSEIILVDDGSDPATWKAIEAIAALNIKGIRLARNVGQHSALLAGIREAKHPIIATLDDDLQNPPEELPNLLAALTDDVDVVYGVPRRIRQSLWRSVASVVAKKSMRTILGYSHADEITSFRVFRSRLRQSFQNEVGPGISIDALLNWATTRFDSVEVQHDARSLGRSNYNFWKLLRFMLDTATGYSTVPLRLATSLGIATVTLSLGVLLWVLGRPLLTGESVPGFPFLAATIAIFSGVQLIILGVLGQYIGRMHFRVMNKPTYTIADRTDRISE
jgi:undecaprenyl-phosphate 4-deoxy-4-formamido-L-arabinose transferase